MKTFQRIVILLAAAVVISLIAWAIVTVLTVASMPTDTMDYYPAMPGFHIDLGLSSLGIFKSLVPITLIVVIEQVIEKWINRQRKKKSNIASA